MRQINTIRIGQEIRRYEQVTSTNTVAKEWAKRTAEEGGIVVAEEQTQGRGRLGRSWQSPKGTGVWMSMLLKPEVTPLQVPQLTLLAGYAMCLALKQVTGEAIQIKWPNDLVLHQKKLCGILCEACIQGNSLESVIVGIGINVNHDYFPETLPHASSLKKETGRSYDRDEIIAVFCEHFEPLYDAYKKTKDLSDILEGYRSNCINFTDKVKIIEEGKTYEAQVLAIEKEGALVVRDDEGNEKRIVAGEVSVRGLYGYV